MKINNSSILPKRYFGLHMAEGLAQYSHPGENEGKPYRILILENALKEMDQTFEGLPVYVDHVEEVSVEKIQNEADGYVVRSFFNKADGKHWVEFLVVSDKGHSAIASGFKLSNAYTPQNVVGSGRWHNVDYQKEVKSGKYDHLAIVKNPRYEESMILTPEQFKEYNSKKELELTRLQNSADAKKESKSMLKFWKRTPVENSADLENTVITLKNGKDKTIAQLINDADDMANPDMMANGDHSYMVGDEKMKVNDLASKYLEMKKNMVEKDANPPVKEEPKKENEEAPKKEEEKKPEPKKENATDHFAKVQNAGNGVGDSEKVLELSSDRAARGKNLYGSEA